MRALPLLAVFFITSCGPTTEPATLLVEWTLTDASQGPGWQQAGMPDEGKISFKDGELSLSPGQPMTGAKFATWTAAGLPETNYSISYEAMRVDGRDIFGMCTFPVGSHQSHATFVIGGWGGTVTGISSIDFLDASENQTRAEQVFESNRWYRVRIEVQPDDLRVWINDRPVVNASIKGKKITLRQGDIHNCLPFGFATWNTAGKIRKVIIRHLP